MFQTCNWLQLGTWRRYGAFALQVTVQVSIKKGYALNLYKTNNNKNPSSSSRCPTANYMHMLHSRRASLWRIQHTDPPLPRNQFGILCFGNWKKKNLQGILQLICSSEGQCWCRRKERVEPAIRQNLQIQNPKNAQGDSHRASSSMKLKMQS